MKSLVGDCFLVQRFGISVFMCWGWKRWSSWTLMTAIKWTSSDHLWLCTCTYRSKSFIGSYYYCWAQTRNFNTTLREKKEVRDKERDFFLGSTVPINCLLSIWYQTGILVLFLWDCRKSWEFHSTTLNSSGWGTSYEGLISPQETLDKAAIQLIFPPNVRMGFPEFCSTPKSYNYSMWGLLVSVLPGLMSFPKV